MMKRLILFSFLTVLITLPSFGQLATVTGNITDSTSQAWAGASVRADFQNTPGKNPPFTWSGGAYALTVSTFADSSANFSIGLAPNDQIVPAGSYWIFTICPNASTQCSVFQTPIFGSGTTNLTALITANITPLKIPATPLPRAYQDGEITFTPLNGAIYYNVTTKTPRFWDGTAFQSFLGSGAFNIFNSTTYNSDLYPGADTCARIQATDTAMGVNPGTITVNTPGTCTTPITISSNHNLLLTAPITTTVPINLTGNNKISCSGPSAIISSTLVQYVEGIFNTLGTATADKISFSGCTFKGLGGLPFAMVTTNPVTNLSMTNINIIDGGLFNLFNRDTQSKNLAFSNISIYCATTCGAQGIYINGQYDGVRVDGIYCENIVNCVYPAPIFISDEKPSLADIIAAAGFSLDVVNIHCKNMGQTCVFTSGAYKVSVQNGTADGCGDICMDAEGSAFVKFGPGLVLENGTNSLVNLAYSTGYWNTASGNTMISHGENAVATNNSGGLGATSFAQFNVIDGNTITCLSPAAAIALDATQFTSFTNNKITDCSEVYRDYQQGTTISGNTIHFTKTTSGSGLTAPPSLYGSPTYITHNTITTDVNQSGACFAQINNDFNAYDTFFFEYNQCPALSIGQWTTTALLQNNGSNTGIGVLWRFQNNEFPNLATFTNTGTNSNGYITRKANCTADTSGGPIPPLCDAP